MPIPPILDPRAAPSPSVAEEVVGAIGKGLLKWVEKLILESLGVG